VLQLQRIVQALSRNGLYPKPKTSAEDGSKPMSPGGGDDAAPATLAPCFTVLLPVHRPPAMLPYAIETVLAQSLRNFELCIIGDGAPDETITCSRYYAARDPRVKVFEFPKGTNVGEAHRHAVLTEAKGRYVAHIADDDLWFPNHLQEMEKLLLKVDFGNLIHVYIHSDGTLSMLPANLASRKFRQRMLDYVFNALGDTVTGYRLEAYRRLPEGWAASGPQPNPDLVMWRKFLRRDDLTFNTRMVVTALIFASERRTHMTIDDRAREVRHWYMRLLDPAEREEIIQEAWRSLVLDLLQEEVTCLGSPVTSALYAQLDALRDILDNRVQIGRPIDFTARGKSYLYMSSGWSVQERDLCWTDGTQATLRIRPVWSAGSPTDGCILRLRAMAFGSQRLAVLVDGTLQAELLVNDAWSDYDIDVAFSKQISRNEIEITFHLPEAHSPNSVGVSQDVRELGIALSSLTLLPRNVQT